MAQSGVFERVGADTMPRRAFFLVIGMLLGWGFFVTYQVSSATAGWQPNFWEFLGIGLVVPMVGVFLSNTEEPLLSFIGLNLVTGGLGAILGPLLAHYKIAQPGVITEAVTITAIVTGVMAVSGVLFPRFYSKIGGALFMGLLAVLVVYIAAIFIPALAHFKPIYYVSAGLFSLYVGYDMWRASTIPSTLANAVDVAVSLYLDIVNLFLAILRISSDDD